MVFIDKQSVGADVNDVDDFTAVSKCYVPPICMALVVVPMPAALAEERALGVVGAQVLVLVIRIVHRNARPRVVVTQRDCAGAGAEGDAEHHEQTIVAQRVDGLGEGGCAGVHDTDGGEAQMQRMRHVTVLDAGHLLTCVLRQELDLESGRLE